MFENLENKKIFHHQPRKQLYIIHMFLLEKILVFYQLLTKH